MQSDGGPIVGSVAVSKTQQWQEGNCTIHVTPGKSALYFKYAGSGTLELMQFSFL
jgi:hypothetical protein